MLTRLQLELIMPLATSARLDACTQPLIMVMDREFMSVNLVRSAAFLAQLAHESGELRYMEEIASGSQYEGRKDLGNVNPGDGKRYKGRGPIQLTGRANYRLAGAALGLDLEGNPLQVADPMIGMQVAGWFWTRNHLNDLADARHFEAITRAINGGLNGQDARIRYYIRALEVFGLGFRL